MASRIATAFLFINALVVTSAYAQSCPGNFTSVPAATNAYANGLGGSSTSRYATYACNTAPLGYVGVASGNNKIICNSTTNYLWPTPSFSCSWVAMPSPPAIANAYVCLTGSLYVKYCCSASTAVFIGSTNQANYSTTTGTWTAPTFSCYVAQLPPAPYFYNAYVCLNGTTYVKYCCNDGSAVISGQTQANYSTTTNSWSVPSFTCASPPGTVCPLQPQTAAFSRPVLPTGANATALYPISQTEVLAAHNCIRDNVNNPKSCPALAHLGWDDDLAAGAERYVATCPGLVHNPAADRALPNKTDHGGPWPSVGQNICVATSNQSWSQCVYNWAGEVADFVYGQGIRTGAPSGTMIGHYTQVVASSSFYVGCGWAYCPNSQWTYQQICNYGPAGNCDASAIGGVDGTVKPYPSC